MNFEKAQELTLKWSELCCVACLNSSDCILLQLMISEIFGNISSFRHKSVVHAMKIREEYDGETSSKPFLTPLHKDIVAYISTIHGNTVSTGVAYSNSSFTSAFRNFYVHPTTVNIGTDLK